MHEIIEANKKGAGVNVGVGQNLNLAVKGGDPALPKLPGAIH